MGLNATKSVILLVASLHMILTKKRITKEMISLHDSAGWSSLCGSLSTSVKKGLSISRYLETTHRQSMAYLAS